jgi:hypothetical protein
VGAEREGGGPATIAEEFAAAERLAVQLRALVESGRRIVVTHGARHAAGAPSSKRRQNCEAG